MDIQFFVAEWPCCQRRSLLRSLISLLVVLFLARCIKCHGVCAWGSFVCLLKVEMTVADFVAGFTNDTASRPLYVPIIVLLFYFILGVRANALNMCLRGRGPASNSIGRSFTVTRT